MRKASILSVLTLISTQAFAQGEAMASGDGSMGLVAIAAAIAIGLAALGGALAQAKIGGSAMEGIARNPKAQKEMFVPMIIGLVLIESLVIYAFVIAFLLLGKI